LTDAYHGAIDPVNNPNSQVRTEHFEYDQLGNRHRNPTNGMDNLLATKGWLNFTRKDNGLNQYNSWGVDPAKYDDDIGGAWGTPGHANGVLMVDGWVTAGYNALNQAVMINTGAMGSNWKFFGYDPLGRCVKRWSGGLNMSAPFPWIPAASSNPATYFYYDGWSLIQEGPNASAIDRVYMLGNRVDEIVTDYAIANGQWMFHTSEARGDSMLLTDWNGNLAEQYYYDAFGYPYFFSSTGQPLNSSTFGNRFLFTGREWLGDLKLYDYRARMYQPELGRFMQPDPKEFGAGDYNLYRYCHNDPVNRMDPTGEYDVKVELVFTLGGAAIGALAQGISDGFSGTRQDYYGAAIGGAIGGSVLLHTGNMMAASVTGAVSGNLAKQQLNIQAGNQHGFNSRSLATETIAGAVAGAVPGLKIGGNGGITHVSRTVLTKLANGTIENVSAQTAAKIGAAQGAEQATGAAAGTFTSWLLNRTSPESPLPPLAK
jgi:RHS repeat-associated protein